MDEKLRRDIAGSLKVFEKFMESGKFTEAQIILKGMQRTIKQHTGK